MTLYFKTCTTPQQCKELYRKLAKQHHPDNGGDAEAMKAVNNQYKEALRVLREKFNDTTFEQYLKDEADKEKWQFDTLLGWAAGMLIPTDADVRARFKKTVIKFMKKEYPHREFVKR